MSWVIFSFHKELSKSYREGSRQKLKSMLFPNEILVWAKKMSKIIKIIFSFYKELSKSYREGSCQKVKSMLFPNEILLWEKKTKKKCHERTSGETF